MHSLSSQFPTLYHHLQSSKQSRSDISLIEEELRLFYYNKGVEVDFCVPEENLAVQVSYNIDDAETYEREVGGLVITNRQSGTDATDARLPEQLLLTYKP